MARQYCGRFLPGWDVSGLSPLGRALVDHLPEAGPRTGQAAGIPVERRRYRSRSWPWSQRAQLGHLRAGWVAGDDAFGMSPSFREALAALGMRYVLDVPGSTTVWPLELAWTSPKYPGFGRPRKPRLREGQRRTMEQRSDELPDAAWREITVAQGSQGPRTVQRPAGAGYRKRQPRGDMGCLPPNLDPSPATTFQRSRHNVGDSGLRGRFQVVPRSSRRKRATWGWTNTRPGVGPAGITTSPSACWAERSC